MELLNIKDLNISFTQYEKGMRQIQLNVIRSLDVTVNSGEMVAVVGASGSGKSLLAHAILGLLPYNASIKGSMSYRGSELTQARIEELRGNEIVMVPQSIAYLDPLMKIGPQIRKGRTDSATKKKLKDIFSRYELKEEVQNLYPFELSGGMNRRILISTALIEEPRLVIADEPTPGLDLKVAKRAMGHFRELADMGAGILVITHDLELALEVADRIVVFYAGTTVEEAKVTDFADETLLRHPYTRALYEALPGRGFAALPGTQPYVKDLPAGCPFAPRCADRREACDGEIPVVCVRGGRCAAYCIQRIHKELSEGEEETSGETESGTYQL